MEENYIFITPDGSYEIDFVSKIYVYKSKRILDLIITVNFPKNWAMTRVFQYILDGF